MRFNKWFVVFSFFLFMFTLIFQRSFAQQNIGQLLSEITKIAAPLCDVQFVRALKIYNYFIFNKTSDGYQSGKTNSVYAKNEGLRNYFDHRMSMDINFQQKRDQLIQHVHKIDRQNTAKRNYHYRAADDFLNSAITIAEGDVLLGVELLASIGHDNIELEKEKSFFSRTTEKYATDSNLYMFGNIGEDAVVSKKMLDDLSSIQDISSSIPQNYHMIAGLFLGCMLANAGLENVSIPKAAIALIQGLEKAKKLNCNSCEIESFFDVRTVVETNFFGMSCNQIQLNVPVDVPALAAYTYKNVTMQKYLSPRSKELYEQGYTDPFLFKDGKWNFPGNFPEKQKQKLLKYQKTIARDIFQDAVSVLDRLHIHSRYAMERQMIGAKIGNSICAKYKNKIKGKLKFTQAEKIEAALFDSGITSLSIASNADLVAVLVNDLSYSKQEIAKALSNLKIQMNKL